MKFHDIVPHILKEARLQEKYAEYETKKDRVLITLKKQKGGNFTRYVESWLKLDKELKDLNEQKKELTKQQNQLKDKKEKLHIDLRKYVINIVDAEEATLTLVTKSQSAQITLGKETEEYEDITEKTDYKKIYDDILKMLEDNKGLIKQVEEIKKNATETTKVMKKAERSLRLKMKEGIFDDILKKINQYFEKFKITIAKLFTFNVKRLKDINKAIKKAKKN